MAKTTDKLGTPITLAGIAAHWKNARSTFDVNFWNFRFHIANSAIDVFRKSFELQRLNSQNSTMWPPRTAKVKRRHPILKDTGTLMNSISWVRGVVGEQGPIVRIHTDPNRFNTSRRHKGFCYAAIHNEKSGTYEYGKSGKMNVRRQFMGHSSVLKKIIIDLSPTIFKNMPYDRR